MVWQFFSGSPPAAINFRIVNTHSPASAGGGAPNSPCRFRRSGMMTKRFLPPCFSALLSRQLLRHGLPKKEETSQKNCSPLPLFSLGFHSAVFCWTRNCKKRRGGEKWSGGLDCMDGRIFASRKKRRKGGKEERSSSSSFSP